MKLSLLQILRCPYCHGELAIGHETRRQGEVLLDITRVGNLAVKPNEGYELLPAGYRQLFAPLAQAMVTEETILQRYLRRLGPVLSSSGPDAELSLHAACRVRCG